ncbi:MAG: SWIM zinc finger family protein [Mycobacteriales bacterium]
MSAGYDDRVRGFPAFPRGTRMQRKSLSWWGNAWIAAVEASSLDPEPLAKGRADAYAGHVGAVTVSPGRIAATVGAPDGSAYSTEVQLAQLTDEQWTRFLDEVAAKAGHLAALLDHDMPHDLVDAADDAGIPLLPGLGDLEPVCSCEEFDHPCRHAAALCYQVARLLDEDPFVLLLVRGRAESEVLDHVQQRAPADAEGDRPPQPVTLARDAIATITAPVPEDPPVPAEKTQPVDIPSALGVDHDGITWLVSDAAARARDWLASGEAPEHFDSWHDAVRLAATLGDRRAFARLRDASGRPDEFPRATRAWGYGAAAGLDVLENPRQLSKTELVAANVSIAGAWDEVDAPAFAVAGNRWTLVGRGLQVRYGIDGRWYPYRDESGEWWPAGPPQNDPAIALADLL